MAVNEAANLGSAIKDAASTSKFVLVDATVQTRDDGSTPVVILSSEDAVTPAKGLTPFQSRPWSFEPPTPLDVEFEGSANLKAQNIFGEAVFKSDGGLLFVRQVVDRPKSDINQLFPVSVSRKLLADWRS